MPNQSASWPGGRTYVFHGTVGEDATAGTHVTSLTVVPGAGNEMLVAGGSVIAGNTTTGQTPAAEVTDGTNKLQFLFTEAASTVASAIFAFPAVSAQGSGTIQQGAGFPIYVSGSMAFVLKITTTAVSVTQTFAVTLRVWGDSPTFTLADSVGSPTLTTNTSGFF